MSSDSIFSATPANLLVAGIVADLVTHFVLESNLYTHVQCITDWCFNILYTELLASVVLLKAVQIV